jgi:peptidyl-tRNA hydrolase
MIYTLLQRKKNFRKIGIERAICRDDHSTCTEPTKPLQLMEDPAGKKDTNHKKLISHEAGSRITFLCAQMT